MSSSYFYFSFPYNLLMHSYLFLMQNNRLMFFPVFRFTEVKTNGNFISKMASWILMEEIMYFPKPLGTQNGEVLKDKTKELPVKGKKNKNKSRKVWDLDVYSNQNVYLHIRNKQKYWNKGKMWQQRHYFRWASHGL